MALAAIISEFKGDALDFETVSKGEPLAIITTVMDTAAKIGIPKLFEPSDAEHADEKIWSLYISFFNLSLDPSHQDKVYSIYALRQII